MSKLSLDERIKIWEKERRENSILVKTILDLANENNIKLISEESILRDLVDSENAELLQILIHLKMYIKNNTFIFAEMKITKNGLYITPLDGDL